MGIKDLLRFLKPYTQPIHVAKYAGKRVGIDAYAWLHRGAYSCSMELSLNSEGEKKLQYINYFMHRIKLLKHHKITPVVVFDGGNIPCKAGTENERYWRRKANKELAMEKLKQGNVNGAVELFQSNQHHSIYGTPIDTDFKTENVEFIVAPYEADAQLAYLSSLGEEHGGIVAIISEDSDLLAYGCPSIIFKMDRFGNGEEIILDKVFNSTDSKPSFRNFNIDLFIDMCVLAGCDFLPSVPGIGIVKAHALVSKYHNTDRVLSVLKTDKGKQVPDDYARSFKEAVAVFKHATIYNKIKKKVEHMKELPEALLESLGGEIDFLGPYIPPSIATAIAEGNLDPSTMEAYECSLSQKNYGLLEIEQYEASDPADAVETQSASSQLTIKDRKQRAVKPYPFEVHREKEKQENSCFTVYSFLSVKDCTLTTPRQVLKERNFSDEAAALSKLVLPSEAHNDEEKSSVSEEFLIKTPDNNPFRKRKLQLENIETTPTTKSSVTEDDQSKLRQTHDSQESVNSIIQILDGNEEEVKILKKSKTSNCKVSGNRKSSILSFFSRI